MKKIMIIMALIAITLTSCSIYDTKNAQILIKEMVGDSCKNIKLISTYSNGTACYAAVTEDYTIKTFHVSIDGIVEEK